MLRSWVRDDLTLYPGDRVQVMQTVYVTNQASGAREKVRMRGGDRITVVDVMPDYDMVLVWKQLIRLIQFWWI